MPECVSCGVVVATADLRRVRNHPGDYVCKDTGGCRRRVTARRRDERAANLSQRNRRRVELALEQLDALADDLGPVFDSPVLDHVARARAELREHVHGPAVVAS